ncbi:M24 family metallopeptidase [Shimazuella kribbensis]|uniref:M24 family metallopeptidase n=1 Tax=Shimazuella kribbensis TaxID=139808 RepID=UPI00040CEAD6|nr:Xaa-Pro peptidase family protein [Shimazuella kribbensis]
MDFLAKIPKEEIIARITLLQTQLRYQSLSAALLTQNVDIFYYTGSMQNGLLYVPQTGEPIFYVKKSVVRAKEESKVKVEPLGRRRTLGERMIETFGKPVSIGLELDVLPYQLAVRYQNMLQAQIVDLSPVIRHQRSIKSEYEQTQIEEAAKLVDQVIQLLPTWISTDLTEVELAAKIEYYLRVNGNINLNRMRGYNQELSLGMITSGAAAATPTYFDGPAGGLGLTVASPQGASQKKLAKNEPILLDFSTVVEGYMIDQTRMAVIGSLDSDLEQAYQVSQHILREVEKIGVPGTPCENLYLHALKMVKESGLQDYFMGFGDDQAKFLGHGVGLEIDELPILANGFKQPLQENMVIAIEPKFTFPDRGVIGIENTYVVKKEGLKSLSISNEDILKIGE